MAKIKISKIIPIYLDVFNMQMVGYYGSIVDVESSEKEREVVFLFNPQGAEISVRVPNSRIIFEFCNRRENIRDLAANQIIEVKAGQVESSKEYENYLSIIEFNPSLI